MNKILKTISFCIIISCNQAGSDDSDSKARDSILAQEIENIPEIERISDKNHQPDFFIINISATEDNKEAVEQVKAFRAKGNPTGYLWIPDYASLSGKELFSVFIGPFVGIDTTIRYLEYYKKTDPNAYAVNAGHGFERTSIFGKYDIRINDKRQFIIFTYSSPKDEEEYAKNGGEDWGWFTNDVKEYFKKHYPDKVMFSGVFYGWLSPTDIKLLEKELSLKGFGYVLINGKNKTFIPHDMPHGVIQSACEFFNIEYLEE
jgi:hypothetical protein